MKLTAPQIAALYGQTTVDDEPSVCSLGLPDRPAPLVVYFADRSLIIDEDGHVASQSQALKVEPS